MTARRYLTAAAVALFLAACGGDGPGTSPTTERPSCYEDEPCWDCSTMGNRICGPGAVGSETP